MTGRKNAKPHKKWAKWLILPVVLAALAVLTVRADWASDRVILTQTEQEEPESISEDSKTAEFSFTALDVGQGEAVVVRCGSHTLLYDGGPRDTSSLVVAWLKEQEITTIDYMISSHYDADHLYGLIGALNVFPVDLVLDAAYTSDTAAYRDFQKYLKQTGVTVEHPSAGEEFSLGDASFTVVCPECYSEEEDNGNSIGIRIRYGDTSFLVCGDAQAENEETMADRFGSSLQSDVLVCSHHGSTYSTTEDFLNAVDPDWAIISCGAGNDYGHPHQRVLDLLQSSHIALFRTDVQGTITATSDGIGITWNKDPTTDFSDGWPDQS